MKTVRENSINNYTGQQQRAVSLTSLSVVIFSIMLHATSFMFVWTIFFEAEANSENSEIKSKRDFLGG